MLCGGVCVWGGVCVCVRVCVRITQHLTWGKGVRNAPGFANTLRILHCFYQLVRWPKGKEKLSLKASCFSSSTDNLKTENVATGKSKYLTSERAVHACLVDQISRASSPALGQPGCVQQHETQDNCCLEGKLYMRITSCQNASWKTKIPQTWPVESNRSLNLNRTSIIPISKFWCFFILATQTLTFQRCWSEVTDSSRHAAFLKSCCNGQ